MTTAPPARRLWFQFGLSDVFFVIVIVAMWMAGEVGAVKERERILKWAESVGCKTSPHELFITSRSTPNGGAEGVPTEDLNSPPATTSFLGRMIGDRGLGGIAIYHEPSGEEMADLEQAFPESTIWWIDSDGIAHSRSRRKPPPTAVSELVDWVVSIGVLYATWRLAPRVIRHAIAKYRQREPRP
jgi:hypothetical protein